MKARLFLLAVSAALLGPSAFSGIQAAEDSGVTVPGQTIFATYCAACHGTTAKGDGPFAASLRRRPADLTTIAKRTGGTFPGAEVARIIDGRKPVKGHGGGDMPVWGDAFVRSGGEAAAEERIARAGIDRHADRRADQPARAASRIRSARGGEAIAWLFAALGVVLTPPRDTSDRENLKPRWPDLAVALMVLAIVRLLTAGVPLHLR